MNEPVRKGVFMRAALELLAEAGRPVRLAELLNRIPERVSPTPYENEPIDGHSNQRRWGNHLAWSSTDMKVAGWITKYNPGWQITDLGREILAAASPDGRELDAMASSAYREHRRQQRAKAGNQPGYSAIVDAALEYVDPGQWTTYGDLATVATTSAPAVGNYLSREPVEGAYRVLAQGGLPSPGFKWSNERRTDSQQEALEAEGVVFDDLGRADESQRITAEDMRAFLEESGVLVKIRRAWLVRDTTVGGRDLTHAWLRDGYASLRAGKLRVVEAGVTRDELKMIIEEDYSQSSYAAKATKLDEFHAFLSRMQSDDLVVTTSERQLHLGVVAGAAEYIKGDDGVASLRLPVNWSPTVVEQGVLASEVKARLQVQYDVVEMTQQLDLLEELMGVEPAEGQAAPSSKRELTLPDATDELAQELHVDRAWLQECIELLRDRPQLIFYGPPGTGKTYIAQRLAAHLAGDNVRLVQFHPAYSYEDFFEGYRPMEDGGLKLKPGPFRKTVDTARENPATPYFLIIDEINRGNLAKIFGELYFLLEYRSQNVDLLYATDDDIGFTLPENVFIIGTMNTADRSIALVDAAMRRRFAFLPLHPSEPPTDGLLRRWLAASGRDLCVAELHDELNASINDDDFKIGPSYFMRAAVHQPGGLERAWRTAILPLLEEHHYGDGIDVAARYGLDAIRARSAARSVPSELTDSSGLADGDPTHSA